MQWFGKTIIVLQNLSLVQICVFTTLWKTKFSRSLWDPNITSQPIVMHLFNYSIYILNSKKKFLRKLACSLFHYQKLSTVNIICSIHFYTVRLPVTRCCIRYILYHLNLKGVMCSRTKEDNQRHLHLVTLCSTLFYPVELVD